MKLISHGHISKIIRIIFTAIKLLAAVGFITAPPAHCLPIGYGYNQSDLEFMELQSPNFRVYHDKRAPHDAQLALKSLEAARPHMESWFKVSRSSPLIVNMSAASENPSFANFITDSIELQTMGQGSRDLAWHEYTHSTMYRYFDNWFGPPGAILHLPWMEAWFLEGLAEALSVSIGSDEQAGVERYQALTDNFPTWDRIHSLYTSGPFNFRGYATSGAFVAWILRKHDANLLPPAMRKLKNDSSPFYWPWALTPFNDFWPMDNALKVLTQKSGKELYEQYKTEANAYWQSTVKNPILSANITEAQTTNSSWAWISENGTIAKAIVPEDADSVQVAREALPNSLENVSWVEEHFPQANNPRYRLAYAANAPAGSVDFQAKNIKYLARNASWIHGPWFSAKDIWWVEVNVESTNLCYAPKNEFLSKNTRCVLQTMTPSRLKVLGQIDNNLWISKDTESSTGDSSEIITINLDSYVKTPSKSPVGGKVISAAKSSDSLWQLTASRSLRTLVKINSDGSCGGLVEISDHPFRILNSSTQRPHIVLFTAEGYIAKELNADQFPLLPCKKFSAHQSPLLAAVQEHSATKHNLGFSDAVQRSSIWADASSTAESSLPPSAPTESNQVINETSVEPESKPATWRGRPLFAFPWLAADDALGPQLGIVSVPLMDEMQNETVRATLLLGTVSRFPYQDVTLISNRFAPTWSLTGFRAQVYNGRYKSKETGDIFSSYLEESGANLEGSYEQRWKRFTLEYSWGIKSSHLKPYIGPTRRSGHLNETHAGISTSYSDTNKIYSVLSLRGKNAAPIANQTYQYDVVGASATFGKKIHHGKVEFGLEGSRTRGPKRRDLQEMYSPLKTLIPGTGGGFNQTSFAITPDSGLFTPSFGENQARAKILATHPVIENIDKFSGLVYIEQLNLSGFANYGGAWRGNEAPDKSQLIAAHGYNADLSMDNKGVRFNLGLGTGQVIGKAWQGYWTFGFDALF